MGYSSHSTQLKQFSRNGDMRGQHGVAIEPADRDRRQGTTNMSEYQLHPTLPARDEAIPTDLLAELLMKDLEAVPAAARKTDSLPAKIYAVMGVTTLLTFATLRTGYEHFFSHQLFG
jgi:hypothetical protein